MEEFKPNSHKSRQLEEKKKVEKVVKGKVSVKKKTAGSKIKDSIITEDIQNVKSYVLFDVLIPALKDTLYDMVTSGLQMMLTGGDSRSTSRSRRRGNGDRESYARCYKEKNSYSNSDRRSGRNRYACDDIFFDERGDAEEVLDQLLDMVEEYGMVSVADYYELAGEHSEFTDNDYGWYDLGAAKTIRAADGYMLKMPRVVSLK